MTVRTNFELRLLWPILLLALSAWGFLKIANEVWEGDAHGVDMMILQACRTPTEGGQPGTPLGPIWLQESIRDLTALGSPAVLILAMGATWGYLMLTRQRAMAWLTAATAGGGLLMAMTLKTLFSRERPDLVYHATVASGYSFPSGHAMMSAVVYLTLAALLARLIPSTRQRLYVVGSAMLITGLIGLSRIYLGVHWASDVAAGWAAGASWALLCWLLANWLKLGKRASQ
mgnify:CR=1 FL=1